MDNDYFMEDNLYDPAIRALARNNCRLRTYQSDVLRKIFKAFQRHEGGKFAVTFPRQSGKNETQAQLEAAVMAASLHRGGSIIKLIPTEKNQGSISRDRLIRVLRGTRGLSRRALRSAKNRVRYGSAEVCCLSASPNAAIVGATADLLLEVDEAQLIPPAKFDREAAPMAAAVNAVQVFWGTAWDGQTLLARESRAALREGETAETSRLFRTDAARVGREVPDYAGFVRGQIESLGRDHPAIRTQFFCEEIDDLTSLFTPSRIRSMKGEHAPQSGPEPEHCYVFLIDIAGSDELTAESRRANGFSDRRDATVLTICDVSLPAGEVYEPKRYVWNVAARRYYRNVPALTLEAFISQEVDRWNPFHIILDHSGLGCLLSDYLSRKYPERCSCFDITAANKTRMAWEFLAMVDSGRWKEYAVDPLAPVQPSAFRPGRDAFEVIEDPALLQRNFTRELQACRMEPTLTPMVVRWGVPDGTRDPSSEKLIHDDFVMSAALAVFEDTQLPVGRLTDEEREEMLRMEAELERRNARYRWENF